MMVSRRKLLTSCVTSVVAALGFERVGSDVGVTPIEPDTLSLEERISNIELAIVHMAKIIDYNADALNTNVLSLNENINAINARLQMVEEYLGFDEIRMLRYPVVSGRKTSEEIDV